MPTFLNNPWTISIFSGIVVIFVGFLAKKIWGGTDTRKNTKIITKKWQKYKLTENDDTTIINTDSVNGDNHVNINIHNRDNVNSNNTGNQLELNDLKKIINILFVDDDTNFKIVKILKSQGWINTKIIADITNLDKYSHVHIFFIDINNVGKKLNLVDQGMGLANCIKEKFKDKKVILYSTDTNRDMTHPVFKVIDGRLQKDAQIYEFTNYIEQFAKEMKI